MSRIRSSKPSAARCRLRVSAKASREASKVGAGTASISSSVMRCTPNSVTTGADIVPGSSSHSASANGSTNASRSASPKSPPAAAEPASSDRRSGLVREVRAGLDFRPGGVQQRHGLFLRALVTHFQQDVGATPPRRVAGRQTIPLSVVKGGAQFGFRDVLLSHHRGEGQPHIFHVHGFGRVVAIQFAFVPRLDLLVRQLHRGDEGLARHRQVGDVAPLQQHPRRIAHFAVRHQRGVGDGARHLRQPLIGGDALLVGKWPRSRRWRAWRGTGLHQRRRQPGTPGWR